MILALLMPAACWLQSSHRVLMVRDAWSRRLSLPGGGAEPGESEEQTAQRETWEETGIQVRALHPELARLGKFVIFRCEPIGYQALPARLSQDPTLPFEHFKSLKPSRMSGEIESIVWLAPSAAKPETFRFPSQRNTLLDLASKQAGPIKLEITGGTQLEQGNWQSAELDAISGLQRATLPWGMSIWKALSTLGEIKFLVVAVPVVAAIFGGTAGLELLVLLLLSATGVNLLKEAFALPRPFDLRPSLQFFSGSGGGMPSGHTCVAAVFWFFVGHAMTRLRGGPRLTALQAYLISAALVLLTGLARVAGGVHFFSDITGGAALGGGLLVLWEKNESFRKPLTESRWIIPTLLLLSFFLVPGPVLFCNLAFAVPFFAMPSLWIRPKWIPKNRWAEAALFVAGLLLLSPLGGALRPQEATFALSLRAWGVPFMAMGAWAALFLRRPA